MFCDYKSASKKVPLGTIKRGDCFEYQGNWYMRIKGDDGQSVAVVKVVEFNSGSTMSMARNTGVEPRNLKVMECDA